MGTHPTSIINKQRVFTPSIKPRRKTADGEIDSLPLVITMSERRVMAECKLSMMPGTDCRHIGYGKLWGGEVENDLYSKQNGRAH
jgi:hypothetical protein